MNQILVWVRNLTEWLHAANIVLLCLSFILFWFPADIILKYSGSQVWNALHVVVGTNTSKPASIWFMQGSASPLRFLWCWYDNNINMLILNPNKHRSEIVAIFFLVPYIFSMRMFDMLYRNQEQNLLFSSRDKKRNNNPYVFQYN